MSTNDKKIENENIEFDIENTRFEDLSLFGFNKLTPEELAQRKIEEDKRIIEKGFLPRNDDYSETMNSPQEIVENNPSQFIIQECMPACQELWDKNIYTFMVSDHVNEGECWIEIVEDGLSDENKEIYLDLSGEDVIKFSYHKGTINFGIKAVGKEGQARLLELAQRFQMQDVPKKQAYITIQDFLMKYCECYTEYTNTNYKPMNEPWGMQVSSEELSVESKKTLFKFAPEKMTKSIEKYAEEKGMIADGDRVYLSKFHYNKHQKFINYEKTTSRQDIEIPNMDKEKIYDNISKMINNGIFLDKYIENTKDYKLNELYNNEIIQELEEKAARIFNAILIGSQLFEDEEKIKNFVDIFSYNLTTHGLKMFLDQFDIEETQTIKRLRHGFGVHFTTPKIADEIKRKGVLVGYGKNLMFTEEEDKIIYQAGIEQRKNNPDAEKNARFLFRGFGTGVSSYGSMTNGYWMYHTPESLSFLFGNISKRSKEEAMKHVLENTTALDENNRKVTFDLMNDLYDKLIGEEQAVCCILIDRDALEYETDYYYDTNPPKQVQRRPYSESLYSLENYDCKINNDIDAKKLKFLKIPTIKELEYLKQEKLKDIGSSNRL